MDANDRKAIEGLFENLAAVEGRDQPRDPQAEDFIRQRIAAQPSAPYYMAQTIVAQKQALEAAERQMEELEDADRRAGPGGMFGGLFGGGGRASSSRVPSVRSRQVQSRAMESQGTGFLAGAAQTAVGVAGGILLGNMIGGMFGAGEAQASQQQNDNPSDDNADAQDAQMESAVDEPGMDGFDVGDIGDFEL